MLKFLFILLLAYATYQIYKRFIKGDGGPGEDGGMYVRAKELLEKLFRRKSYYTLKEQDILQIAKERGGVLSAFSLAMETGTEVERSKGELEKLVAKGYAELKLSDRGLYVYEFSSFKSVYDNDLMKKKILECARACGGRVSALDVATEVNISVEQSQDMLEELVMGGHAKSEVVSYGTIYEFPRIRRKNVFGF